jgi:hypothetical protein
LAPSSAPPSRLTGGLAQLFLVVLGYLQENLGVHLDISFALPAFDRPVTSNIYLLVNYNR